MQRLPTLIVISSAALLSFACGRGSGPLRWNAATLVADGATDPTVAVDSASGKIYLAWAATRPDSALDVLVATASADGAMRPPLRVNIVPGELATAKEYPPQVVIAGRDTVLVSWVAFLPGEKKARLRTVKVARSVDGGATFGPPTFVTPPVAGMPTTLAYHDIAASPGGGVIVSWIDFTRYTAKAAEYGRRGAKVDPWHDMSQRWAEQAELRVARSVDAGATFATAVVVDTLACICCRTAVVAGRDGLGYTMSRHVFDGMERDFVVNRIDREPGKSRPAVRVHLDKWKLMGCPDIGPDIAVGADARVHVAWYTGAEGEQGLHYASSDDGGTSFGVPIDILAGADVPTSEVKLAVAGSTPWLVWEDQRAGTRNEAGRPQRAVKGAPVELRIGFVDQRALHTLREPVAAGRAPAIAATARRIAVAWTDHGKVYLRSARIGSTSATQ